MNSRPYTLILMRHGEAEGHATSDHRRSLTPRGREDSNHAGVQLQRRLKSCDLVISSDAARTQQTARHVVDSFQAGNLILAPDLYVAHSVDEFHRALTIHLNENVNTLLVVGHNPAISTACSWLTGSYFSFAPADYGILAIESASWETALHSQGCWNVL
jgi:phosphohistidine phosphatase